MDWKKVLGKAKLFHVSGITPALSPSAAETTAAAMKAAKEAGCLVSYDLNYRKKLWSPAEAKKVQEPLMKMVDLITTTEEDTGVVFGIREQNYQKAAEALAKTFGFKAVAITLAGRRVGLEEQLDGDRLCRRENLHGPDLRG